MTEPVVVGRRYKVPCIKISKLHRIWGKYRSIAPLIWIPVWPQSHNDPNLGLHARHYHIDWRFVSDAALLRAVVNRCGAKKAEQMLIKDILEAMLAIVITTDVISRGPTERLRCCHRDRTVWSYYSRIPERLELEYRDVKMKCGRCPHWGFDLRSVKPVNGVVQCPGHGLCWKMGTGELVPRRKVHSELCS